MMILESCLDGDQVFHPDLLSAPVQEHPARPPPRLVRGPGRGQPGRYRAHHHQHLPVPSRRGCFFPSRRPAAVNPAPDRVYLLGPRQHRDRSGHPRPAPPRADRHEAPLATEDDPRHHHRPRHHRHHCRRGPHLQSAAGHHGHVHGLLFGPQRHLWRHDRLLLERLAGAHVVGRGGKRGHHVRLHPDSEAAHRQDSPRHDRRPGRHGAASDGQDPELSSKLTIKEVGGHQAQSSQRPSPMPSQNADGAASEEGITVMDFLTTPDMQTTDSPRPPPPGARRNPISTQLTSSSMGTTHTRQENSVYFGFVNMKRPKSMLKTSASESFRYCTVVTILFFLWGFSYGLLNTLNNVVADVANMSTAQTLGLTSAYFGGGYFFGPLLIGEWVLRHDEHHRSRRRGSHSKHEESIGGFKATFMVGLCFYGSGTIMLS